MIYGVHDLCPCDLPLAGEEYTAERASSASWLRRTLLSLSSCAVCNIHYRPENGLPGERRVAPGAEPHRLAVGG